jgi:hypothetical protein
MDSSTVASNEGDRYLKATPCDQSEPAPVSTRAEMAASSWSIVSTQQSGSIRVRVVTRKTRVPESTTVEDL